MEKLTEVSEMAFHIAYPQTITDDNLAGLPRDEGGEVDRSSSPRFAVKDMLISN